MTRIHEFYGLESPNANLIDTAISQLHTSEYNADEAFGIITSRSLEDLTQNNWNTEEIEAFESGIVKHGLELALLKPLVPTRTMKEVVHFYYKWKKSDRYVPTYSQFCKESRPTKSFSRTRAKGGQEHPAAITSDGNDSAAASESEAESLPEGADHSGKECAFCSCHSSERWRPRFHAGKKILLCYQCHWFWMRYAMVRPVSEASKKANKENGIFFFKSIIS